MKDGAKFRFLDSFSMREGVRVREGDKFWGMVGLLRGGAISGVVVVDFLLAIDGGNSLLIIG